MPNDNMFKHWFLSWNNSMKEMAAGSLSQLTRNYSDHYSEPVVIITARKEKTTKARGIEAICLRFHHQKEY